MHAAAAGHPRPRLEDRLPLRAADGAAHGRPDLLAVHQRHPDEHDDAQLPRPARPSRSGSGTTSGCSPTATTCWRCRTRSSSPSGRCSIKFVTGMTIALILNSRLPLRSLLCGDHAAALDRAGDRHGAGLEEHLRPAVRRPQPDPAGPGHHRPAAGLAVRSATWRWAASSRSTSGRAFRSSRCCCLPASRRSTRSSSRRPRSTAPTRCSASATSRCRACATSSSWCCCCRFISTFNQFGLIFLMTGGGPSGATKLYSILAYEKAIGSLQYGPGSAIALSVAPLMAVLIWLLAQFMRHDDRADGATRRRSFGTHVGAVLRRGCSALILDVLFWPFEHGCSRGLETAVRARSAGCSRAATASRCSSAQGRERWRHLRAAPDPRCRS